MNKIIIAFLCIFLHSISFASSFDDTNSIEDQTKKFLENFYAKSTEFLKTDENYEKNLDRFYEKSLIELLDHLNLLHNRDEVERLAHLVSELVVWDQIQSQIIEHIWHELRSQHPHHSKDIALRDNISELVKNKLGRDIRDSLKDQIEDIRFPLWVGTKSSILCGGAWGTYGIPATRHLNEHLKVLFEGDQIDLDASINAAIHYSFIIYQITTVVMSLSHEFLEIEENLAEKITKWDHFALIHDVLEHMQMWPSADPLITHQLTFCDYNLMKEAEKPRKLRTKA